MIHFERFVLANGLRVLVHEDKSTPMAVVNVLYDVGARDENPAKTGFAHLFEHLMFGGSINIPVYDEPLQQAGGENGSPRGPGDERRDCHRRDCSCGDGPGLGCEHVGV